MADKEIPDMETLQGGPTVATAGDKVHAFRSPNSRVITFGDAAGKSVGTGSGTVAAGDVVAGHGTSISALQASEIVFRRAMMNSIANEAKALAGYQRFLDLVGFGFMASGDADVSSTGGSVTGGAWKPGTTAGSLISQATGTNISNGSTPANVFDGNTSTYDARSAQNVYWGKNYTGSPKAIGSAQVDPTLAGYDFVNGASGSVTITLYGKSSAPSSGTDGTVLGSTTFTDGPGTRTITSSDVTTTWNYVWVNITTASGTDIGCSEVRFYSPGSTNNAVLILPYQTADAARTKVRGIFEIDPVDAITLGTDWTVEYTCNGGTNWAAASTYTNCGKGQSGRTVIETEEVTCTSGTSFSARIKNLNTKAVHVYKAALKAAA